MTDNDLGAFWALPLADIWEATESSPAGVSEAEAAERLRRDGPNLIGAKKQHRGLRLLLSQFTSPIILILVVATVLSIALGDLVDGAIILLIIAASGLLGFSQERSAGQAVDALLEKVQVEVTIRRGGVELSVPIDAVVVGDIVILSGGDVVPADARLIESISLLVDETALTGESFPVEKAVGVLAPTVSPGDRTNSLFMGTHVVSGRATVVVTLTGRATEFGAVSAKLGEANIVTGFERGITRFGLMLVRVMAVLVTSIFVINVILNRPLLESFLFSLALAVGLTPQLLPAIVSVSLATGARRMAAKQVIVKRLDAIEDFGAMTALCTDKTGTITAGSVRLDGALDLNGQRSEVVLALARLNAGLQQGFSNPLDDAILAGGDGVDHSVRLDEIPYDFSRKRLSVLAEYHGESTLITKGAFEAVLAVCDLAIRNGQPVPLETVTGDLERTYSGLSAGGNRVLALATRDLGAKREASVADEAGMTLQGLLVFFDPPKTGAAEAIRSLEARGVTMRLVTGDNRLAAAKIATDVGLSVEKLLTGPEVAAMDDTELMERAAITAVFAEVEPLHKERIVRALRASGEIVGFLGDGINDAPALHAADVGISVDTAVDVAKQAAAIVLLDKSLSVIEDGVDLGRQTFANTLKYIRVTTSANFGNMLSMAAAAVFLPFLPLLPRQILLLNFLTDFPGLTIAGDTVDPEQLERPRAWSLSSIRTFMIVFGLISTGFDLITFATLRLGFNASQDLFRSGWFVESALTELAVMLILRTNRSFFRSRPAPALLWSSVAVAIVTVMLPFTPVAGTLGLTTVPLRVLAALAGLTVVYIAANEFAKRLVPPAG